MATFTYRLECGHEFLNGSQIQCRANTRQEADKNIEDVLLDSKLAKLGIRYVLAR